MAKLQQTLCEKVLEQEQCDEQNRQVRDRIDAVGSALLETTSLNRRQINAVVVNLQEEAATLSGSVNPPLFKRPSINPQILRIVGYIALGLLAYSAFKSAQINTLKLEQSYNTSQHSRIDLQIGVSRFRGMAGSIYQNFYKQHKKFPDTVDLISGGDGTGGLQYTSTVVDRVQLSGNGNIRLELTESYGYNRWVELTPRLQDHPLSVVVNFDCRSNAENNLLHNNGLYWCEYSPD